MFSLAHNIIIIWLSKILPNVQPSLDFFHQLFSQRIFLESLSLYWAPLFTCYLPGNKNEWKKKKKHFLMLDSLQSGFRGLILFVPQNSLKRKN